MIYLKSLELTNFKSFIGNNKIPFSQNFTVITGPNGSGKSNILDAIRWVLGEQRVKTLRAEKTDEVIFGGNKFYSQANYAKVELCLNIFGEDYFITRKIYRDEDSEYYINGKMVRLKDIQLFLNNFGLGRYGFAFLGQGEIEDLILKENGRIRELIENIAGISGYHEKVKELMLKLEVIESKWNELEEKRRDLFTVVEGLRKEVRIAERYDVLKSKLEDVRTTLAFISLKKLRENIDRYLEEEEKIEKRILELNELINVNSVKREELSDEYRKIEKDLLKLREILENIDKKVYEVTLKENVYREKERLIGDSLRKIEKEKILLKEKILDLETKEKEIVELLKNFDYDDFSKIEAELKEKENRLQELILNKGKLEDKIRAFEPILKEQTSIEDIKIKRESLEGFITKYRRKIEILQKVKEEIEVKLTEENRILRRKKDVYENNKLEILKLNNILAELKEATFENLPRGVRELLLHKKDRVHDIVKNIINVPKEYLVAIYNLLGNTIYDIVVDNEDVAKELIGYLKDKKLGWATFRPLTLCRDERIKEIPKDILENAVRAIDVVSYDLKYDKLVKNVLGNVLIFTDFQTASMHKNLLWDGWRIVTLQGEVFHPSGTISGGVRFGVEATLNTERAIFETEEKIKDYSEANVFLKRDIEDLENSINKNRKLRQKLENLITKIESKINEKEKEIREIESKLRLYEDYLKEGKNILEEFERLSNEVERTKLEFENLRKSYDDKRFKKIETEKDLVVVKKDLKELNGRLFNLEEEEKRFKEELKLLEKALEDFKVEYENIRREKEIFMDENKKVLEEGERIKNEIKKLEREWQKLREEFVVLEERKKDIKERIKDLEFEYQRNYREGLEIKMDLPEEDLKRLEIEILQEMESLGPINFLAKAKLEEEEAKYNSLVFQIEDIEGSINSLKKIIKDTREEAERRFLKAFEEFKIKAKNNWKLFFPNAELDLLVESEEDILDSDISLRIYSQKKNWRNLLMLSGGEKSIVGIVLLLSAVELASVNFCFWDEIDAALDNQNAQILGKKIKELSERNQFILISHNPVLMQYADVIYGVTLNEKGSSQVLSWKVKEEV
ncbi:ATP-binding protein [Dictyoglomus thermophilum]|uniref:Chromosome segregation SMC protein, putative n=1 Tax=Dictyoglomus thermophilum (strain ATCC 35947 / DSM 3960 / H-6-12) TaxID=309799 RepID=B5YDQ6_DICT6|nr:chromosome segregation SMC family protein [Dictyoglomus thermophilum]ACI18489.1 chromosome segregation SMC protein, putative [Dictyoglomus thermophilum H-6-12]